MIGYDSDIQFVKTRVRAPELDTRARDLETVASEQVEVIKAKITGIKVTEEWANKEKQKALSQLEQTTDESERKRLQEAVEYFDQVNIQAKRRYNEIVENQFKRMNSIINDDKTR
jgi:hypothetical protein